MPLKNIDDKKFKRNKNLKFDREVDYKLISVTGKIYRIEVKLMGKGNPESADVIIARDTNIFIADVLSDQNRAQLENLGIEYLTLKNNKNLIGDFKAILKKFNIPHF